MGRTVCLWSRLRQVCESFSVDLEPKIKTICRAFDCGIHTCQKPCHPQEPTSTICPRSPSQVFHCPCGKHALSPSESKFFPAGTKLRRTACTDPIPTCESTCMKPLEGCDHLCASRCHTGSCPPCSISLVRPCRCGSSTRDVKCFEEQLRHQALERGESDNVILCERACAALRNCGRHQCNRPCCPLASLAAASRKGKKKVTNLPDHDIDEGGWHECDLVCGKLLSCGNHNCEERDHRGPCPPCLRSSFEEVILLLILFFCRSHFYMFCFRCSAIAVEPFSSLRSPAVHGSTARTLAVDPTPLVAIPRFRIHVTKILLRARHVLF